MNQKYTDLQLKDSSGKSVLPFKNGKNFSFKHLLIVAAIVSMVGTGTAIVSHASPETDRSLEAWSQISEALKQCESKGDYILSSGNGLYGAYQIDYKTWRDSSGYKVHKFPRADIAPAAVQDQVAFELFQTHGLEAWHGSCTSESYLRTGEL